MKKIIVALSLLLLFIVVGCNSDKAGSKLPENQNKENNVNINEENSENENEVNNEVENDVVDIDVEENDKENNETNFGTSIENDALALQVTLVDQNDGVTIENNEVYQELNGFVEMYPDYGDPDDFSVYVYDSIEIDGEYRIVLLAINRLNEAVKNVDFKYTFGKDTGEYVFEKEHVVLGEETFGVIKPNHAIPFMLDATKEQVDLLHETDETNTLIEFHDVDLEYADIEDALALQVTKGDADDGITLENNDVYQELDLYVKLNPMLGDADDFSVYVINTLENEHGQNLVLLAINRLDEPVKNIKFDYTLGKDTGEFIFEKEPVDLDVALFGEIKVNHAMPFTLTVTDEQIDLMNQIDETNQVVDFHNFDFEYAN